MNQPKHMDNILEIKAIGKTFRQNTEIFFDDEYVANRPSKVKIKKQSVYGLKGAHFVFKRFLIVSQAAQN